MGMAHLRVNRRTRDLPLIDPRVLAVPGRRSERPPDPAMALPPCPELSRTKKSCAGRGCGRLRRADSTPRRSTSSACWFARDPHSNERSDDIATLQARKRLEPGCFRTWSSFGVRWRPQHVLQPATRVIHCLEHFFAARLLDAAHPPSCCRHSSRVARSRIYSRCL